LPEGLLSLGEASWAILAYHGSAALGKMPGKGLNQSISQLF